jgi:hypothetical protein
MHLAAPFLFVSVSIYTKALARIGFLLHSRR